MSTASSSISVLTSRQIARDPAREKPVAVEYSFVDRREDAGGAGAALTEYFRVPAESLPLRTSGRPSGEAGYFTFNGVVCYGRCSAASPAPYADATLPEIATAAEPTEEGLCLPFDFTEVITNLRRERYRQKGSRWAEKDALGKLVRRAYYGIRPLLRVGVRKHLQKLRLKGWQRIPFPHWPVDVSVERLMQETVRQVMVAGGVERLPFIWFWPDGAPGCVMMTHDVEGPAGREFCTSLMDLDESFSIPSAFHVIPDPRPETRALFDEVRSRGFEANIHDLNHDCSLFADRAAFSGKAAQINDYAREFGCGGFRSGAMYREQSWYDAFRFSYDMSVPNVAHLEPQRGGCCTVMPYFVGDILELPLTTIQDYSLFHILGDYSIELWKKQIEMILAHNGLISFIVHPDYVKERPAFAVYRDLLEHLSRLRGQHDLWVAAPGEVNRWWRSRQRMSLVPDGSSWRIEGPDSDRARVAHATLRGDRVVYELPTRERVTRR